VVALAALIASVAVGGWQLGAVDEQSVPPTVMQASANVRIAVIDTGADVSVPELAARNLITWDARTDRADVRDTNGHGTFVASVAAAYGGNARLSILKAGNGGSFTDAAEAASIRYAVAHGAKIINLSVGGTTTSKTERAAIRFAIGRGALVVAAAGNEHGLGDPVEYPAALLQPVGSNGAIGRGLVVGASSPDGARASFSNAGSWISLAAPGVGVYGALLHHRYGYGSGTSFATPQVAGAAALVWAADPRLTAQQVAEILEETATGDGAWTPELGWGVIDVGAAVARAQQISTS
jgi:subtilisin family serine protease